MERMLAVMADNPPAACAGLVAMVCLAVWPLFRTRSIMLSIYVGNNLAFVLHYALLHHWTAVAMNGLIAVQTVAAIGLVRYPRLRLGYVALMPVMNRYRFPALARIAGVAVGGIDGAVDALDSVLGRT